MKQEELSVYTERAMISALASALIVQLKRKYKRNLRAFRTWDDKGDLGYKNLLVIEVRTKVASKPHIIEFSSYEHWTWKQLSWHISDEDSKYLSHLRFKPDWDYDGHTTEEKYKTLLQIIKYLTGTK